MQYLSSHVVKKAGSLDVLTHLLERKPLIYAFRMPEPFIGQVCGEIWQSIKVGRSVYFKFIHREARALYWHQHQYPVNRQAWMLNDYKIHRLYSNLKITPLRQRNESAWQPAIFRPRFDWSILFGGLRGEWRRKMHDRGRINGMKYIRKWPMENFVGGTEAFQIFRTDSPTECQ